MLAGKLQGIDVQGSHVTIQLSQDGMDTRELTPANRLRSMTTPGSHNPTLRRSNRQNGTTALITMKKMKKWEDGSWNPSSSLPGCWCCCDEEL